MTDIYFEEEEFTTEYTGKTTQRIVSLTKSYGTWVLGFLISIALVSSIDSYLTFLSKQMIDQAIIPKDHQALYDIALRYGGLIITQAIFVFSFIFFAGVLGERIRYDLRKGLFNHLQDLSLSFYNKTPVGWIISRVTSDTDRVAELVTWGLLDVTWGMMNIATAMYFMLIINWKLALIVLAAIPILVIVAIQFRKRILVHFRQARKVNSKITGAFNENITGVRVVKALCREDENLDEFKQITDKMYVASYRAAWLSALFLPVVQIISSFAMGAIVWFGGLQTSYGTMTIGGIQAFISYLIFMLWPIQDLARVYAELQQAIASAERIFSLQDEKPEITDSPTAENIESIHGAIEFIDVHFTYQDGETVLSGFNLAIKPGEKIALVGPTGGGKTTIVNLICRFFEPTSGKILLAGVDYKDLTQQSIQSKIGIVLQTPHLFSGSIRENILYGRLSSTDDQIEHAAELAGASEFIADLEKGYDEDVGEGGNLLSTGQKQLISLARAILSQPEIFIMDEATSSVDTITEELIQQGMHRIMAGRTSIIIAHRLSTIRKADRILVIMDGQIAESGTHSELIHARGYYYRLYTQQFRQEKEVAYSSLLAEQQVNL